MQADIIYPWTQDAVTVALPLNLAERLAKLRQIVCGEMLQIVPLHEDTFMCIREDAKLHVHIKNNEATRIAHMASAIDQTDYIAGTAVIVPRQAIP